MHPRWAKMPEPKCRDRKGNAGSAKGLGVSWAEVRGKQWERDLEGEEGWERHAGRSMTVRSEASALFPVTSPAPRTAASTEGRLPKRRLNGRMDRLKEGIRI